MAATVEVLPLLVSSSLSVVRRRTHSGFHRRAVVVVVRASVDGHVQRVPQVGARSVVDRLEHTL